MAEDEAKGLLANLSLPSPRSAALSSLLWLVGILMAGTVGTAKAEAPKWVTGLLGVLVSVAFVRFLITYNYLLIKRPAALGSTAADAKVLEIQAKYGLLGDNRGGYPPPAKLPQVPVTPREKPVPNRFFVALDGGNAQQRDAITFYIDGKGWQLWHWFADLWLVANVPDSVTANSLFRELSGLAPVRGAKMLVSTVADTPSYFGSADGRSWPWMSANWGGADLAVTPGQPSPASSVMPRATATG